VEVKLWWTKAISLLSWSCSIFTKSPWILLFFQPEIVGIWADWLPFFLSPDVYFLTDLSQWWEKQCPRIWSVQPATIFKEQNFIVEHKCCCADICRLFLVSPMQQSLAKSLEVSLRSIIAHQLEF
jgi:hypothetical protein